ncbi:MAG TPA: TetR/AcrR family transcriptional regulator [Reyranella sp.]|nr:TetR/AcrR family transcriptional regulator [Reyranella sp.]
MPTETHSLDGRRMRSERTRQRIVEAYLSLLGETGQMPTANQIAERAGCSVRSIFERFTDLHALRVVVTDSAFAEANAQAVLRDVDADRPTRLQSQVRTRAQTCERWLPMWRALNANQGESEELKTRIRQARDMIVRRLELMYRPELAALAEDERRKVLLALEAITDFESWARMREHFGLSVEDAINLWIRTIDGLLPQAPVS